jgi:hypothetical protein
MHKKERGCDEDYRLLHMRQRRLFAREEELRRQAAQEFAALNGWRLSRSRFMVKTLLRAGVHGGYGISAFFDDPICRLHALFDHVLFFRESARPYRAAAIVGQPYDTAPADAIVSAAGLRLGCHVPPKETASWWYPGWTRFFVFTRLEVACVQFLPEQMEKLEDKS